MYKTATATVNNCDIVQPQANEGTLVINHTLRPEVVCALGLLYKRKIYKLRNDKTYYSPVSLVSLKVLFLCHCASCLLHMDFWKGFS